MSLLNRISKNLTIQIATTAVNGLYFSDLTSCIAWLNNRRIDAARIVIAGNATTTNISACTAAVAQLVLGA